MSFCQSVCELILGDNTPDANLWIQINSVQQPVKRNSVGSGIMSQIRTSAFTNHLDYRFIVLKIHSFVFLHENTSRLRAQNQHAINPENSVCRTVFLRCFFFGDKFPCSGLSFCFRFGSECNTYFNYHKSQRSSAGSPSIRNPASREIISASAELCDTHAWFLHIQLIGTNV